MVLIIVCSIFVFVFPNPENNISSISKINNLWTVFDPYGTSTTSILSLVLSLGLKV